MLLAQVSIAKMGENRDFDFVIFGASGVTGKSVVAEVQRVAKEENITWAIAGRNKERLSKIVTQETESQDPSGTETQDPSNIIIADVDDYQSLLAMCNKARVILDCVGPYKLYGESVLKACIESKADYVDICGEPLFLENMALKYNSEAERAGIYIVGSCAIISIISEFGVLYTKQEFEGTLNGIKSYLEFKWGKAGLTIHFGTYESLVHTFGDMHSLRKFRKSLNQQPLPMVGPKLKWKSVHRSSELKKFAFPTPEPDVSVVGRSQRYLYEKLEETPIQYTMYGCVNSFGALMRLTFFGGLFEGLAVTSFGRNLLLKHPKFFSCGIVSREGPTEEQIEQTSFSLTMYGEGYTGEVTQFDRTDAPDKKIVTRISGPTYATTPIVLVQAALTIVREREQLPPEGGVYTPGAAFYKTNFIKRLQKSGINFEVL